MHSVLHGGVHHFFYFSGRVYKVEMGKLAELEYLSLRGVQWTWSAIDSLLRCASEVKHLVMKIEFSGDYDTLQPFPEIDLVDFFNGHQKLKTFEIHGAMFAALCQRNSLKNVSACNGNSMVFSSIVFLSITHWNGFDGNCRWTGGSRSRAWKRFL